MKINKKNIKYIKIFMKELSDKNKGYGLPVIKLIKSEKNARNPLAKTGFYSHDANIIFAYVTNRHIKDIIKTLFHEYIHYMQYKDGRFEDIDIEEGYFLQNAALRELEREAYEKGNMFFRAIEDKIKCGV